MIDRIGHPRRSLCEHRRHGIVTAVLVGQPELFHLFKSNVNWLFSGLTSAFRPEIFRAAGSLQRPVPGEALVEIAHGDPVFTGNDSVSRLESGELERSVD